MSAWHDQTGVCSEQPKVLQNDGIPTARCELCLNQKHGVISLIANGRAVPGNISPAYRRRLEEFGFVVGEKLDDPAIVGEILEELGFVLGDLYMRYPGFRELTMPEGWRIEENRFAGSYDVCDPYGAKRVRFKPCDGTQGMFSCQILARYERVVEENVSPYGGARHLVVFTGNVIDHATSDVVYTARRSVVTSDPESESEVRTQLKSELGDFCHMLHDRPFDVRASWTEAAVA